MTWHLLPFHRRPRRTGRAAAERDQLHGCDRGVREAARRERQGGARAAGPDGRRGDRTRRDLVRREKKRTHRAPRSVLLLFRL